MSIRDTVLPNVAAAVAALVIYVLATQLFSDMAGAKSVVGGVLIGAVTFVVSLIVTALLTAGRSDDWRRG